MLKKTNQLFKAREVGNNFDTPLFKLKVYKSRGKSNLRIVVSKKIDKRAVIRNKTKRVYKKAIKDYLPNLMPETQIVIFAKKSIGFEDSKKIEDLITDIFKKLNT